MPNATRPPSSQADELSALIQDVETIREVSLHLRAQIDHSTLQLHEAILLTEHYLSVVAVHLAAARAAPTVREVGGSFPLSELDGSRAAPQVKPLTPVRTRSADGAPGAVSEPVVAMQGDGLEQRLWEQTQSLHRQANANWVELLPGVRHAAVVAPPASTAATAVDSPTPQDAHDL